MTAPSTTRDDARLRPAARLAIVLSTTLVPTLTLPLVLGLATAWNDRSDEQVATHFSLGGTPDAWGTVAYSLGVTAGVLAAMWLGILATAATGFLRGITGRRLATFLAALHTGVAAAMLGSLGMQLGAAGQVGWTLLPLVLVAACLSGGFTWATFPAAETEPPARVPSPMTPQAPLGAGEQVAWFGAQTSPWWVFVLVGGTMAASIWIAGGSGMWFLPVVIAVVLVAALLLTTYVRVRVDARGLHWQMGPGWPRGHVALADIASADVVALRPGEYGGWGYRGTARRKLGIVLRNGPALQVVARDGRHLAITLAERDAAEACETLRQLAARAQATGTGSR